MKAKNFLSSFLLFLSLTAVAEDNCNGFEKSNENTVVGTILTKLVKSESSLTGMVTTQVFPVAENDKGRDIICIGHKWHDEDSVVSTLLARLVKSDPQAIVSKMQEDDCFDKSKISPDGQVRLVQILNRINQITESKIAIPVDIEGTGELKGISAIEGLKVINAEKDFTFQLEEIQDDKLRNEDKTFGRKLLRGAGLIQGTQVVGMGILLLLPKSITKWEDDMMSKIGSSMKRAWTKSPVWDKDEWAINYIGHPVSGAMYYNALRSQGATPLSSFIFSTGQSLFWEYGPEAMFERPSIQDILFTSTIGSVMGEASHRATLKMSKNGFNKLEKVVVTIINPMFVLNNGYKKKNLKRN